MPELLLGVVAGFAASVTLVAPVLLQLRQAEADLAAANQHIDRLLTEKFEAMVDAERWKAAARPGHNRLCECEADQ